ncbi:MAG: DNA replication/repair protein RecF [Nitriliruptorales bacterium]
MLLRRLEVSDFRSYRHAVFELAPGATILLGPNAHGKTNLLEAMHRVGTGTSHRTTSDAPLVREGAEAAVVRVSLSTDAGRNRSVELELRPGRGSRARVDGQDVARTSHAVGVVRVVLFAPEDLAIVRGDPSERRRFLDDVLAQRRPAFAATRAEYERVLRQRNQLLRSARGLDRTPSTLEVWTEELVRHATALTAARIAAVHAIAGPTERFYAELADRPESVRLSYRSAAGLEIPADPDAGVPDPGPIEDLLRRSLVDVAAEERARGVTLAGPHRDDLDLSIRDLPVRGYASHGQLWSLALALRLATYDVLADVGDRPVVLLDDVFAELDDARRERLAALSDRWEQVVVSAASERDVPLEGDRVEVRLEDGASTLARRGRPLRGVVGDAS